MAAWVGRLKTRSRRACAATRPTGALSLIFPSLILGKRNKTDILTVEDVDRLLDYLCHVGKRCVVDFQVRLQLTDPDDEMVLEAAIASGSDWIVTHNVRDLADGSSRFGVEVLTPAAALRQLGVSQ